MTNNQNNAPIDLAKSPTFITHFNKYIKPHLKTIEKQRKQRLTWYIIIMMIIYIPEIYLFALHHNSIELIGLIICPYMAIDYFLRKKFNQKTKQKLLTHLFSYLGDFKYCKQKTHNSNYFRNIKMIKYFNNSPKIDDYIIGTYKDLPIEIEEVKLTETTGSSKHRSTVTVFNDLILSLPQIKETKSLLIIRNKKFHNTQNEGTKVLLEDQEFNRIYETSSNNQIEARYILTPTFMEYLKSLNNNGITVTCCFQDNKIYIAVKTSKDMFEPPFFKSSLNINAYREIIIQLENILKIIDVLKLDQNIGL